MTLIFETLKKFYAKQALTTTLSLVSTSSKFVALTTVGLCVYYVI